jgi:hypothetical protein
MVLTKQIAFKNEKTLLHITLFFYWFVFSQNEQLAQYYYDKGDFEKQKSAMKNC